MTTAIGSTCTLDIGGMTCASCVRHVEKALSRIDGVRSAEVNLATEAATVSFDPQTAGLSELTAAVAARKILRVTLSDLLDDGTGQVNPALAGLFADLAAMPVPGRGLNWLRNNPEARQYLRGLARGDIPLTHEGLHELPSWRAAAHLRDLLMAAGALPRIDRQIMLFDRWSRHELRAVADPGHAQILRQFTTWHLLARMRARAARRPLTAGSRNTAANKFALARKFLTWLASQGRQLYQVTQADIDTWYATRSQSDALRRFLNWAMTSHRMPRLDIRPGRQPAGADQPAPAPGAAEPVPDRPGHPAAHTGGRLPAALRPARHPPGPPDRRRRAVPRRAGVHPAR
jgi:copper chaperone CopZ